MEITFNELKDKEIINIYDGKKLGKAIDISFDKDMASVIGIIVPGEHKIFRKTQDIFIPISNIKKIGEDVMLVKIAPDLTLNNIQKSNKQSMVYGDDKRAVYARYKRVVEKEK